MCEEYLKSRTWEGKKMKGSTAGKEESCYFFLSFLLCNAIQF